MLVVCRMFTGDKFLSQLMFEKVVGLEFDTQEDCVEMLLIIVDRRPNIMEKFPLALLALSLKFHSK